ncbi:hypothetical protein [Pseudomonas chlororaphis]|uniref:hypothetical protein n=1 Tax=Pseudomonas chlororaphis TaxID=587753 RepID=UPI0039E36879
MREAGTDEALVREFHDYIRSFEVQQAFMRLVQALDGLDAFTWTVRNQGKVRSLRIYQDGVWLFAVMPSQFKLRFHWRPPAIKLKLYDKQEVINTFGPLVGKVKTTPHWAIDRRTENEVKILLGFLAMK